METAVVVGNFDGVHVGHLHLLRILKEEAQRRGLKPLAITLEPHPSVVLGGDDAFCRITSAEEKRELVERALGVELKVLEFTEELAQTPPDEFLRRVLMEHFGARLVVVGYDWRFGKNAEGDASKVEEVCAAEGCAVVRVEPYEVGGKVVSSSLVRKLLKKARLKEAELYLGRPYWVQRRREKGWGFASRLGFPTLNFGGVDDLCLPNGVYAVSVGGQPAIAYLGNAPSVKNLERRILEVHLLGDPAVAEEENLRVVFRFFLREEMIFKNAEDLAEKVKEDIEKAKELFLID